MSHNVSIKGIQIDDMPLFAKAVAEINRTYGTAFELKIGEVASRNYANPYAPLGSRDGVRVIPGTIAVLSDRSMEYDITLTKTDGKVSMQTEVYMVNDLIQRFGIPGGPVNVATGESCAVFTATEQDRMQAALGRFGQHYSAMLAERAAALSGHATRRTVDKTTGVINVVATVN